MKTAITPATTSSVAIRYGLLTGLLYVIFLFVVFVAGLEASTAVGWLGLVFPVGGIYLAHQHYKTQNSGFMSYGQGLGIGVLLSIVSGLITGVFNYVYRTFIDPEMNGRMLETVRTKMEEGGNMSDEQIDGALKMSAKFSSGPVGFAVGLVVAVISGFIIALIISAFTKHNRPEFE